jgi:hypothetical protein
MNLTMNVALHAVKELQEQVQAPHNPADACDCSCYIAGVMGVMCSHVWCGQGVSLGYQFGAAGFAGTAQTDSTTFEMEDFSAMRVDSDKVGAFSTTSTQARRCCRKLHKSSLDARSQMTPNSESHTGLWEGRSSGQGTSDGAAAAEQRHYPDWGQQGVELQQ